jgi:ribosomal-protein-alanine N-acetyltransferase
MPLSAVVVARTERLLIAEHEAGDLADMHVLLSDPVAMYYLPDLFCPDLAASAANLAAARSEIGRPDRVHYFFKIVLAETGAYVGEIGFTVRLDTPVGQVVNLGYFIRPKFWRHGLTSEAAGAVIRYAFTPCRWSRSRRLHHRERRSEAVMRKNGMIREAEYRLRCVARRPVEGSR